MSRIKDINFTHACKHTKLLGPCFQTGQIKIISDIHTQLYEAKTINYYNTYIWVNICKLFKLYLLNWFAFYQHFCILFNSLSKVLLIFPSRYLYTKVLSPVMNLMWISPHTLRALVRKNTTQEHSWRLFLTFKQTGK